MAKRNVLHISKLENLKKWLVQDGWNILPSSNNPYEVLRVVKDGKQNPLIIYSGKSEEHLSFADRDMPVIGAFLRDEKKSQKNMMYRYIMCGMFTGLDGEMYEIEIPSPLSYKSKEDAMRDERFGYRFAFVDVPLIVIYENENYQVKNENGKKILLQWIEGDIVGTYTYEEFRKAGGEVRMLKPEMKGYGFIDAETDFHDTNKSFRDIFPNMQTQKLYYIDNEAYYIRQDTIEE